MNSNNFANFVKELRLEKKMSQNELAKALYVHRTTVNKWENGKVIPLNETLLVISDYFDVSVDELLNGKRNDADTDRTVTNNVLVSLLKSKTKFIRLFMISLVLIFLLIGLFLLYYFINTYNSLHVYRVFGDNGNIRFKDGLIITSNDKVYFKLGNFLYVDSENSISDIDYVSVYYYDKINNISVIDYKVKDYILFSKVDMIIDVNDYCYNQKIYEYNKYIENTNYAMNYSRKIIDGKLENIDGRIYYGILLDHDSKNDFKVNVSVILQHNTYGETLEESKGTYEIRNNKYVYIRDEIIKCL